MAPGAPQEEGGSKTLEEGSLWPPLSRGAITDWRTPQQQRRKHITPGQSRIGASAAHAEAPHARTPFTLGVFHASISCSPPSGRIR